MKVTEKEKRVKGGKDKERIRVLSIWTVEAGSVSPTRCHVSTPSRFSSARPVITVMDGWLLVAADHTARWADAMMSYPPMSCVMFKHDHASSNRRRRGEVHRTIQSASGLDRWWDVARSRPVASPPLPLFHDLRRYSTFRRCVWLA